MLSASICVDIGLVWICMVITLLVPNMLWGYHLPGPLPVIGCTYHVISNSTHTRCSQQKMSQFLDFAGNLHTQTPNKSQSKGANITRVHYFRAYQQVVTTSYFILYPLLILLPHYFYQIIFSPPPPPFISYAALLVRLGIQNYLTTSPPSLQTSPIQKKLCTLPL